MMGAKSHAGNESSGPAEPSLPHQQAVDMTAPETFTTAPRQPLTKGRRPDMTGICADRTASADVNLPLADRGLGRLNWADSGPTAVARRRTGVSAIAVVPLRARNGLHRPNAPFNAGRHVLDRAPAGRRRAMKRVTTLRIRGKIERPFTLPWVERLKRGRPIELAEQLGAAARSRTGCGRRSFPFRPSAERSS